MPMSAISRVKRVTLGGWRKLSRVVRSARAGAELPMYLDGRDANLNLIRTVQVNISKPPHVAPCQIPKARYSRCQEVIVHEKSAT